MAYFPNGTSGDMYTEDWCEQCLNYREDEPDNLGCPVLDLHFAYNYKQCGKGKISKLYRSILEHFIPTGKDGFPEKCKMFIENPNADIPGQMKFEQVVIKEE